MSIPIHGILPLLSPYLFIPVPALFNDSLVRELMLRLHPPWKEPQKSGTKKHSSTIVHYGTPPPPAESTAVASLHNLSPPQCSHYHPPPPPPQPRLPNNDPSTHTPSTHTSSSPATPPSPCSTTSSASATVDLSSREQSKRNRRGDVSSL